MRAARAEVDLGAVAHNTRELVRLVAPAQVCAVVKADGYGHGAIAVSEAALDAGASWLGVALVEEGAVLRKAGIDAPILLLSQPRAADIDAAVRYGLRLTLYTRDGVQACAAAARARGQVAKVHIKVDSGMNRVGVAPADALDLAQAVISFPELEFEGVWTHCAVADEPSDPFTDVQLNRFDDVIAEFRNAGVEPAMHHAANSAAAIDRPRARLDLVRIGIALYGIAPLPAMGNLVDLRPALSLRAEVSLVKRVRAGEGISYGRQHKFVTDTTVATVPIGYADGVPRRLSEVGGEVLIDGRRRRIVGVVTMDQLMIDCGNDDVEVGDEVVLLGAQGDDRITAQDWADALGTIPYEVVCRIGPRVPRHYLRAMGQQPTSTETASSHRNTYGTAEHVD